MKSVAALGSVITLALVAGASQLATLVHADRGAVNGDPLGPDVAVCSIPGFLHHGSVDGIAAFSFSTTGWNVGDEVLVWEGDTTDHPVIAQHMYRYHDGRFEMLGFSWVKHGLCAVHTAACGGCPNPPTGCIDYLLPGCTDPYSAFLNGMQIHLGPRSEINAATSEFPYPYTIGYEETGNAVYKRLQINTADLNQDVYGDAEYFVEAHYIHPQEGNSDLRHNNASYRKVTVSSSGSNFSLAGNGPTIALLPAIYAWQDIDPDVVIETADVPDDGRYHLGYRVTELQDGSWRYEYALHNFNSHRSARGFTVPIEPGTNVLDTSHRDVKHHSGELFSDEDWNLDLSADSVRWFGHSYAQNPQANVLRWGTVFNFAIVADVPPVMHEVVVELYRPAPGRPSGSKADVLAIPALVPGDVQPIECPADLSGPDGEPDGVVDVFDLIALINQWGPCDNPNDCPADLSGPDSEPDGNVDVFDLIALVNEWGDC